MPWECTVCVAMVKVNPNFLSYGYLFPFIYPFPFVYPWSLKTEWQRKGGAGGNIPLGKGTPPDDKKDIKCYRPPGRFYDSRSDKSQTTSQRAIICSNSCHGSGVISVPVHNKFAIAVAIISNGFIRLF